MLRHTRWFTPSRLYSTKPSEAYYALVSRGDLTLDTKQAALTRRYFDPLYFRLNNYKIPTNPDVKELRHEQAITIPRGLYIHGGVGTGKSMLLDLFYRCANVQRKRRVHFNTFMLEVQARLNDEKKKHLDLYGRQRHIQLDKTHDVIYQVAHIIAEECHFLCFDEFQVTNVADALIMRKLFGVMFERGIVMVATSNTAPKDLYKEGTNRDYFLPFLNQLNRHTRIVSMESNVDYRFLYEPVNRDETFLSPLTMTIAEKMDAIYQKLLISSDQDSVKKEFNQQNKNLRVPVMLGRILTIQGCVKSGVCRVSFRQLCDTEKGAADYKAIAECFHTLVLDNVPILNMAQHDQVRRFILLIDELYEHRTRLILSSEAADPNGIFQFDDKSVLNASNDENDSNTMENETHNVNKENGIVDGPITSSGTHEFGEYHVGSLVALKDLKIAFQRTVSRLREMQSAHYLEENVHWRSIRTKRREIVQIIDECS
ncbi:lactation elevated protein 1 [Plasmopara halstedii]|uniref:Lactation elevated protein 1 n=1 Tax=Plasmopara halstedii TaxID=4781 RepID=A0A0P1A5S4_PLAHL|nr:lactation elevated protein 1 [Plasmopara halstedii]CEG35924.1 lactation elevated protein 1 [Plasmopara halstedii]|eukprot:XP_024572293.1 lactation elevated protein 1 [Plasmopara halstedii]